MLSFNYWNQTFDIIFVCLFAKKENKQMEDTVRETTAH